MLASHPMCWKEILHYSIETSFPEWMIQWLTALPRMYLGKNPLYGGWTDVKPCMIKCWIVRKVPQTRILVGDVETGCISNFPTLQAVQEPPCHGGCGTHMGHLMIDQYQGSGRGRGPTCDLDRQDPRGVGSNNLKIQEARMVLDRAGFCPEIAEMGSVETLEILGIVQKPRLLIKSTKEPRYINK